MLFPATFFVDSQIDRTNKKGNSTAEATTVEMPHNNRAVPERTKMLGWLRSLSASGERVGSTDRQFRV